MSLEDKFFPEDGTLVTKIDNFLIKSAGKIGEAYQHVTGRSGSEQVKHSYLLSGVGSVLTLKYNLFLGIYGNFVSFSGFLVPPKKESPIEEEIRYETQGKLRDSGKVNRLLNLITIPVLFGTGYLINKVGAETSSYALQNIGNAIMIQSLAWIPNVYAKYLSKANLPKPPKKSVFSGIKHIYSSLVPHKVPKPQTIPVEN